MYNKVFLAGITKPISENTEGCQTSGELISFLARVSNPNNQANHDSGPKLLKYLMANKHWSPFEMVSITLGIKTTRDISRQILRHRSFSFQEFSQRYADPSKELGFTTREARLQDHKNRQNSIEIGDTISGPCDHEVTLIDNWEYKQKQITDLANDTYKWAVDNGIAKEQARAVLPEGLTFTTLYMAGTLRSWLHFIEVRTHKSAQKEVRDVALKAAEIIKEQYPELKEAIDGIIN